MGAATEAAKKAAEQLKKDRAEMEKKNYEQMEELAKQVPTPTIEEVQKALRVAPEHKETEVKPVKAEKTSEPKPDKSAYSTREVEAHSKK